MGGVSREKGREGTSTGTTTSLVVPQLDRLTFDRTYMTGFAMMTFGAKNRPRDKLIILSLKGPRVVYLVFAPK